MIHSTTKTGFYLSMKLLKDFSFLFILLCNVTLYGQVKVTAIVVQEGNKPLSGVEVFNVDLSTKSFSDAKGQIVLELKDGSANSLVLYKDGFLLLETSINSSDNNKIFTLEKMITLSEVVIQNERAKLSNINKLRDVEETAIYAGKKTEVIAVAKLTANKSINNTRQMFAQVGGLSF